MASSLPPSLIALALGAIWLLAAPAAEAAPAAGANGQGWALEERALYQELPDLTLTGPAGEHRSLVGWSRERPLLVTFAYAHCSGVCQPLLRQLEATTSQMGGRGVRYDVVVIGLDPQEPAKLLEAFGRSLGAEGPGWSFMTGEPAAVTRLHGAIGAWARPRADGQIDHPAVVGAIRNGRLMNAIAGAEFSTSRLAVALTEAEGDFHPVYPEPGSDLQLRCFSFQGEGGGFALDWGALLLVTPGFFALVATTILFRPRRPASPR